jgi:hypothetical protein
MDQAYAHEILAARLRVKEKRAARRAGRDPERPYSRA